MKIFLFIAVITIGFARSQLPECPPSGQHFLPHPENCQRFILCHQGQAFIQECAAGLGFDAASGACNFQGRVNCPCRGNEHSETSFHCNPRDCASFIACHGTEGFEARCAPDLHFDPISQICDWPENVDCDVCNATSNI